MANVEYLVVWFIVLFCYRMTPSTSTPIRARAPVCVQNTWEDVLVFYTINYLAHAGTTHPPPGAKWYLTFQWTISSLFLPFVGLGRSFAIIYRHMTWGNNELYEALASNALVVVARTKDWKPLPGQDWPRDFHETTEADDKFAYALGARKIYGNMKLPSGYTWIMVSHHRALPDVASSKWNDFRLSRSHSWLKMALAIAHLTYSCITIYRRREEQIDRYGYAAFGLSIFPYAFMSLMNFICAALVGLYPCVYALTSPEMEEAKARDGAIFEGAIEVSWGVENDPREEEKSVERTLVMGILFGCFVIFLQYLFLFLLSRFEKKQSTLAQRAWMMAWVCANQVSFFPFAFLSSWWPHFLNSNKNKLLLLIIFLPMGVAAVGGLVEVGKMLRDFGPCASEVSSP